MNKNIFGLIEKILIYYATQRLDDCVNGEKLSAFFNTSTVIYLVLPVAGHQIQRQQHRLLSQN